MQVLTTAMVHSSQELTDFQAELIKIEGFRSFKIQLIIKFSNFTCVLSVSSLYYSPLELDSGLVYSMLILLGL